MSLRQESNTMRVWWQLAKNTWDETFTYRFSFLLYRIRSVLQLLTVYFLWKFFLPQDATFLTYNQSEMLTYILGTSLIASLVMSSRSQTIGSEINEGKLSNYLLRPISYFKYWFARDLGDKAVNILFTTIELFLLIIILKPPLLLQENVVILFITAVSAVLGMVLYFYFSVLLGLYGFWSNEVWGPRFVFWQLITFFAGGLFPLDILPKSVASFFELLPFGYLMYFPLKIYLGQLSMLAVIQGGMICVIWIFIMHQLTRLVWMKGLRVYTAFGK